MKNFWAFQNPLSALRFAIYKREHNFRLPAVALLRVTLGVTTGLDHKIPINIMAPSSLVFLLQFLPVGVFCGGFCGLN